ncbi:MAG: HEAT repeat domain-containing protein [Bradymonadia bacterium]
MSRSRQDHIALSRPAPLITALGRALITSGVMVGLVAGLSVPAFAAPIKTKEKAKEAEKIATVRYSYEAWSRAGDKRYVLVPEATEIEVGNLPDRIRALFTKLVSKKKGSYGKARLAFKPDAEQTGVVYVYLDTDKGAYHPIVMAETVYTFTENGASKVIFPKKQDDGWTRADVPQPAYMLSLPLHQVLPPNEITSVLVQLPSGDLMTRDAAVSRLKSGDEALVKAFWGNLDKGGDAALATIKAAPLLGMKDLQGRLLPVLKMADKRLRSAALTGLDGMDNKKVNAAIRKIMDDDREADLKDQAAAILSKSKDPKFSTAAQYHALRSENPEIVKQAAVGLGNSKEKEAGEQLLKILNHADAGVRDAAIASLQKRGDFKALSAVLADSKRKAEVRTAVAQALIGGEDKTSRHDGLMYLVVEGEGPESAVAAAALTDFDDGKTYDALGKALKHKAPEARIAAAKALGTLAKPSALKPLAAAGADDAESGVAVLDAVRAVYGAQNLDFVLKGTGESDKLLRRAAVSTLGDLVAKGGAKIRRKALSPLRKLAGDSEALIRAAAARSFGIMKGDDVKDDLMKLADDKAVEVQRETALALQSFPGEQSVKFLMGYTQSEDTMVLAHALESLGTLEATEGLAPAAENRAHKEARVRQAATGAMVKIGYVMTGKAQQSLMSYFNELVFDKDAEVRRQAVEGFRLVKNGGAVSAALGPLVQDPDLKVRKATLMVVASTHHPSAVEVIASALEDDELEVRKAAIEAFKALKLKAALEPLNAFVGKEADATLVQAAKDVIKGLN